MKDTDKAETYRLSLLDHRWKLRRQQVMERKGRICEACGGTSDLHVHHGYYLAGRPPWDYPDSALHVLCSGCHEDEHSEVDPSSESRKLIRSIASRVSMAKRDRDPRAALWGIARSRCTEKADAAALMRVLCWIWFKRGIQDLVVANGVAVRIASMKNPYAFLQPGGKAIEALIGAAAVERACEEKERNQANDEAASLAVRRG